MVSYWPRMSSRSLTRPEKMAQTPCLDVLALPELCRNRYAVTASRVVNPALKRQSVESRCKGDRINHGSREWSPIHTSNNSRTARKGQRIPKAPCCTEALFKIAAAIRKHEVCLGVAEMRCRLACAFGHALSTARVEGTCTIALGHPAGLRVLNGKRDVDCYTERPVARC
ncbi:hypothetical protein K491DRAFT_487604 [Lophiostoma macrostomum CBS 122681]|uniref:Uncharacterized protein n=1 Tax=Lophiostoma macrostomum CBS 122681 TaxID=1314788 RepID=A0A6A6T240_9PLEO|nr:hypothetical protein K491DRAFT_487604 [Lophiostoma macrostomum CBS 122681]